VGRGDGERRLGNLGRNGQGRARPGYYFPGMCPPGLCLLHSGLCRSLPNGGPTAPEAPNLPKSGRRRRSVPQVFPRPSAWSTRWPSYVTLPRFEEASPALVSRLSAKHREGAASGRSCSRHSPLRGPWDQDPLGVRGGLLPALPAPECLRSTSDEPPHTAKETVPLSQPPHKRRRLSWAKLLSEEARRKLGSLEGLHEQGRSMESTCRSYAIAFLDFRKVSPKRATRGTFTFGVSRSPNLKCQFLSGFKSFMAGVCARLEPRSAGARGGAQGRRKAPGRAGERHGASRCR